MGFSHLDALEALLVAGDPQQESQPFRNDSDLAKAIDYLFCAPDDRKLKFAEGAKAWGKPQPQPIQSAFSPLPPQAAALSPLPPPPAALSVPPSNSAIEAKLREQFSALRQRFDAERKQHEQEKRQLEREMYKEVLSAVVSDGCVNRYELDRLEALRHKKHISMHIHDQACYSVL